MLTRIEISSWLVFAIEFSLLQQFPPSVIAHAKVAGRALVGTIATPIVESWPSEVAATIPASALRESEGQLFRHQKKCCVRLETPHYGIATAGDNCPRTGEFNNDDVSFPLDSTVNGVVIPTLRQR